MRRTTAGPFTGEVGGRWNAAIARATLAAWRSSGLSLSAFAQLRGLNAQRLSWWRKRLGDEALPARRQAQVGPLAFLPAVVTATARTSTSVTVRLPRGVEVEVASAEALPADWVAALTRYLLASE